MRLLLLVLLMASPVLSQHTTAIPIKPDDLAVIQRQKTADRDWQNVLADIKANYCLDGRNATIDKTFRFALCHSGDVGTLTSAESYRAKESWKRLLEANSSKRLIGISDRYLRSAGFRIPVTFWHWSKDYRFIIVEAR